MSAISPERLMIESDYDDIKLQIVSETNQVTETQPALNLQYARQH